MEKLLEILVDSKPNHSNLCHLAAAKANKIMQCIKRDMKAHDENIILRLHKSLVRPHMKYCVQKDIVQLEWKLSLVQLGGIKAYKEDHTVTVARVQSCGVHSAEIYDTVLRLQP